MSEEPGEIIFPEIWRLVFKELDTKSRLECKLVCEDWYEILQDAIFKDDRRVVIRRSFLSQNHPAVLALSDSDTKFDELTVEDLGIDPCSDLEAFWQTLGETVKIMFCRSIQPNLIMKALKHFEVLDTIAVDDLSIWVNAFEEADDDDEPLNETAMHLTGQILTPISSEGLRRLLASLPNLQEINLPRVDVQLDEKTIEVLSTHASKIKTLNYNENLETLFNKTDLKTIIFPPDFPQEHMNQVLDNRKSLKTYCVLLTRVLPTFKPELVFSLKMILENESMSLYSLKKLVNCRILVMATVHSGCFTDHKVCHNDQLFALTLQVFPNCIECLTTVLESARRIECFRYANSTLNDQKLTVIAKYLQHVKQLDLIDCYIERTPLNYGLLSKLTELTELALVLHDYPEVQSLVIAIKHMVKLTKLRLKLEFGDVNKPLTLRSLYKSIGIDVPTLEHLIIDGNSFRALEALTINDLNTRSPESLKTVGVDLINFKSTDHTKIVAKLIQLFQTQPRFELLKLKSVAFSREIIEQFLSDHACDTGPSMHMWPLMQRSLKLEAELKTAKDITQQFQTMFPFARAELS